jgi:NADH dehydrogenase FAD-containing subunit
VHGPGGDIEHDVPWAASARTRSPRRAGRRAPQRPGRRNRKRRGRAGRPPGTVTTASLVAGATATLARSIQHVRVPEWLDGSRRPRRLASTFGAGTTLGLLTWILVALTVQPMFGGGQADWTAGWAGQRFAGLVGCVFGGGGVGLAFWMMTRAVGEAAAATTARATGRDVTRVVVLGGGFGGVATATRLEQLLGRYPGLEVTLVSRSNYLLFTPMLAEVAARSLEGTHISAPVRAACPLTRFRRATVEEIDPHAQVVHVRSTDADALEALPYDHLVLALGAVPNYLNLPGVAENSFALKTLDDATTLRDHVIHLLEAADTERDPVERRRKLTFVVAGGGFAGTELVAGLHDMVHDVLHYFPSIPAGEPRFVLIHGRDRILPELGPKLAGDALARLRRRGIEFALGRRVAEASDDWVRLNDDSIIPTRTLVWTAGNQPNPLLASLPLERGATGAVMVNATMQVKGFPNVWAIGDCAQVPDLSAGGRPCPPTAQHATRQGKGVASNIAAVMSGSYPRPFRFRAVGFLVSLGRRTAAAELRGQRFFGFMAWLLWRGVYLSKLPGMEKRVRVLVDWTVDGLFPRDITLTSAETRAGRRRVRSMA